jgi:hypothetical protein
MRTFEWDLEDVATAHPALYLEHCVIMACRGAARAAPAVGRFHGHVRGFFAFRIEGQREFLTSENARSLQEEPPAGSRR